MKAADTTNPNNTNVNTTPASPAQEGAIRRGVDAVMAAVGGTSATMSGASATNVNIHVEARPSNEDVLLSIDTMMRGAGMGLVIVTHGAMQPSARLISGSLFPKGLTVMDMLLAMYTQCLSNVPRSFLNSGRELVSPFVPTATPMLLLPPATATGKLATSWIGYDVSVVAGGAGDYTFSAAAVVEEEGTNAPPPPPLVSVSYTIPRGVQDGFSTSGMILLTAQDPLEWNRLVYRTLVESAYYPGPSVEIIGPSVTPTLPAGVLARQYLVHRNYVAPYAGFLIYKAYLNLQSATLVASRREAHMTFLTGSSVQGFVRALQTGVPCHLYATQVKADAAAIGLE